MDRNPDDERLVVAQPPMKRAKRMRCGLCTEMIETDEWQLHRDGCFAAQHALGQHVKFIGLNSLNEPIQFVAGCMHEDT
eukprot:5177451-Pyramimonas_sp.AAC.1